ncbi:uncharacterized protein LOC133889687 [Phragmites australis]|uniref:uncharacterized protein LOC133889687 n=1 Tax=Phragmites australis TaxID=29695 RepID=UPI002D78515B|nr:uncharacterized protein LOC133889687 [Phragmites australis]
MAKQSLEKQGTDQPEASTKPIFCSKDSKVDTAMHDDSDISNVLGKLQETNEGILPTSISPTKSLPCKTGEHEKHKNMSTENLVFDNDYTLTPEDIETSSFIRRSYKKAIVVDIGNNVLTVEHLQPNVNGGWLLDAVINTYAYINHMENEYTTVLSTFQSRLLLGETGGVEPKHKKPWVSDIGRRCATRHMVFVPFNALECHWSLLVLNFRRKQIQILNSLASTLAFRDEKKENILVESIQACMEYAVEASLVSLAEPINLAEWDKHMYTNIPQQNDSNSCGVYVIKYMLAWNGCEMNENFTQEQMNIFRQKICSRLLRSECNLRRRPSYKEPLTKEEYMANNPEDCSVAQGDSSDDDVMVTSTGNDTNNCSTSNTWTKKRGRPRKNGQNTKPATQLVSPESAKTIAERVQGTNHRASIPSQYQLSPYKQH